MLKHYSYDSFGKADHGWLKSAHHFSFAHYYNPDRMGFGQLRVVNDDWVAAGTGFPTHPHRDMEIISFVRTGAVTHKDSEGNQGTTQAGEVQVMSAGTGVMHSEYNLTRDPLTFYQIWIQPNQLNVQPRWEAKTFLAETHSNELPLLVSGFEEDADKALFIHQEARIFGGVMAANSQFEHSIKNQAYVMASSGAFNISDTSGKYSIRLNKGDAAEITDLSQVSFDVTEESEIILIDVPKA